MRWGILGVLAAVLVYLTLQVGPTPAIDSDPCPFELRTGYHEIVDEADGTWLTSTGRVVREGDAFITPENQMYRVNRVDNSTAYASLEKSLAVRAAIDLADGEIRAQASDGTIGVYHSHSSESYVPSDGADSIEGGGGILDVGTSFAASLERQGVDVIHDKTSHDPHDAGSYVRSRRTASDLNSKGVVALFDVHRDTAPPDTYRTEIDGREVAQVLLVVGTQNPRFAENLAFAQELKAAADEQHPGLIRGILKSASDFNQDIMAQSVILEVGAHRNTKDEAQDGVALLAEVIPGVVGAAAPGGPVSSAGWRVAAWFVGVAIAGTALYFYLSSGSMEEALDKARTSINPKVWMDRLTGRLKRR